MMKKTSAIMLLILFVSVQSVITGKEVNYRAVFVVGEVQYRSSLHPEWTVMKNDTELDDDCMIRTGPASQVVLERGKTRITVGEDRMLSIKSLAEGKAGETAEDLASTRARLGRILSGRKHVTSTVVVAVRGERMPGASGVIWSDDLERDGGEVSIDAEEKAMQLYLGGRYRDVVTLLEPAAARPGGSSLENAPYLLFLSHYNLGNFERSLAISGTILSGQDRDSGRYSTVLFMTALIHNTMGNYDSCISLLERFIKDAPADSMAPEARFMLAGTLMIKGRRDEARAQYEVLVKSYPESPAAARAREMLNRQK